MSSHMPPPPPGFIPTPPPGMPQGNNNQNGSKLSPEGAFIVVLTRFKRNSPTVIAIAQKSMKWVQMQRKRYGEKRRGGFVDMGKQVRTQ
jgi:pre-mRNA-processing factor 8